MQLFYTNSFYFNLSELHKKVWRNREVNRGRNKSEWTTLPHYFTSKVTTQHQKNKPATGKYM